MKQSTLHRLATSLALAAGLAGASVAHAQYQPGYGQFPKDELPMIQRSVLPGTTGPMGEIGFDSVTGCRYFAATRSNQIEVMDPMGMSTLQSIKDISEPMGVCVVTDQRKVIFTCGDGNVRVFDIGAGKPEVPATPAAGDKPAVAAVPADPAGKLTAGAVTKFPGAADPIRWDAKNKRAILGHGKFVSWFNPADGSKSPKGLEMPGPVRAVCIEPGSSRAFIAIPSQMKIVVLDRDKWEITETWDIGSSPFALALDDSNGTLFVACRNPGELLMLDTKEKGKQKHKFAIGEDTQDCWWDPIGLRVYVTCGGGNGQVAIIWNKFGTWTLEHQIETATGARTSLLTPEKRLLVVCAPSIGGNPTFVYIYVLPNAQEHHDPQPKHN